MQHRSINNYNQSVKKKKVLTSSTSKYGKWMNECLAFFLHYANSSKMLNLGAAVLI